MQLILTKGLPASGKSTHYKILNDPNLNVITKDDLRKQFPEMKEKQIIRKRDEITLKSLADGKNVCWCDTNYNPIHEARALEIAKAFNADVIIHEFNETPEVCIERDLLRETGRVGSQVIWKMYYEYVFKPDEVEYDVSLPGVILCDIDGTLAKMKKRRPFEWDKVDQDEMVVHIAQLLNRLSKTGIKIILLSGRDSVCRDLTINWLNKYYIQYDELYMRPEGDMRDDREIKEEIYREKILGNYNVELILDDRPKMVRHWMKLGLPVVNVQGHTDFEF